MAQIRWSSWDISELSLQCPMCTMQLIRCVSSFLIHLYRRISDLFTEGPSGIFVRQPLDPYRYLFPTEIMAQFRDYYNNGAFLYGTSDLPSAGHGRSIYAPAMHFLVWINLRIFSLTSAPLRAISARALISRRGSKDARCRPCQAFYPLQSQPLSRSVSSPLSRHRTPP